MISIISQKEFKITKKKLLDPLRKAAHDLRLRGQITIKIGTATEAKELNQQFRNKNYATDVLSFPVNEKLAEGYYIGDIFICYPLAADQAQKHNNPLEKELLILSLHGILHLAGYDHEKDQGEMLKLQQDLIDRYGI